MRVVSRGELRELLQKEIEDPSRFRYRELPDTLAAEDWETLDDSHKEWYAPVEDSMVIRPPVMGRPTNVITGYYTLFKLTPGSYDAFIVY